MNRRPSPSKLPHLRQRGLIGCMVYCPLKANGILPDTAGILCAGLIMVLRYLSLIMGWRTKPPRDYSDTVVESVARPMRFIARKVHVPIGKTPASARAQPSSTASRGRQEALRPPERPLDGRRRRADANPPCSWTSSWCPWPMRDEHASNWPPILRSPVRRPRQLYRIIGLDHEPRRQSPAGGEGFCRGRRKNRRCGKQEKGKTWKAPTSTRHEKPTTSRSLRPLRTANPDPKKPQHNPRDLKKRS